MKKTALRYALPFVAAALCVVWAADKVDYDHHVDFGRYHTYSWIRAQADNPLWQDRIMQSVDNALQSKGWQKADAGEASVAAYGSVHNEKTYETYYNGFGGGWFWRGWWGPGTTTTTVQ